MTANTICGLILAGGQSLRYSGQGGTPKALALVGKTPIILHVAAGLVHGGARKIIVLTGANHGAICEGLGLVTDQPNSIGDLEVQDHEGHSTTVPIELRFSGNAAGTAGRLLAVSTEELGGVALLSYTDILSDAPLAPLVSACNAGADLAILAVRPNLPWGVLELSEDGAVTAFAEKPREMTRWINGGVIALTSKLLQHVYTAGDMLEADVIPRIVATGTVRALRHTGAWYPLDSPKDVLSLNRKSADPCPNWRRWARIRLIPAVPGDQND